MIQGRLLTRVFLGDRELVAEPALLEAAAALCRGAPLSAGALALLRREGVMRDEGPPAELLGAASCWALRPQVALEPVLRPREVRGRAVLPEASLPVSLFVPPERLGPLQRLAATLRSAYGHLVRAAHSRGHLVDPADAERILGALCRELYAEEGAAWPLALAEAPLRLEPRAPLQDDEVHYPIAEVRCYPDRRAALRPVRLHTDTLPFPPYGQLLGLLGGGVDSAELLEQLWGAPPAVGRWVYAMLLAGMIGPLAGRAGALRLPPGAVLHLGHATLLANLGGEHVLLDPWLPPASDGDRPPPPAVTALPPLAAIFLTHHHWDHVHLETLLKLDKRVPVYVPRQTQPLCPRTAVLLRYLGFTDVRTLGHGEVVMLGDGGAVTALPFHGEDPTRMSYGGNCYLLHHEGRAALVHVDSGRDAAGASLASSGLLARLVGECGPLSPVFATRRQERGMMVEHTWEFLLRPPAEWVRPTENCDCGAASLASLCRAAAAPHLVLYSEGGADWYPEGTDFLRRPGAPARMLPYEYLWDGLDEIARAAGAAGAAVHLSSPYDLYQIGGGPLGPLLG